MDSANPEFWEQRYRAGRMPWDAGTVPRAFAEYLRRAGPPGAALIPGCGSAYEAQALVAAGWAVTAIDFSPGAVARARDVLGPHATCVREADFFRDELGGPFDLIYERTFLCSLPPSCWTEYAMRAADLLAPDGRLAGFFFYGREPEPPPYPLADSAARALFGSAFVLTEDVAIPGEESLPLYAGAERWQVWTRRPDGNTG